MSSAGHDEGFYRDHYPPPRPAPDSASPQRSERHYQGYQIPRADPKRVSSHQYRQDPHVYNRTHVNIEELPRGSASTEWRREPDPRRTNAHPHQHGHREWREQPRYPENYTNSKYIDGGMSVPRGRWGADLNEDQRYSSPAYESESNPVNYRSGSGMNRGRRDEHSWSWDVRDGRERVADDYDDRGREYQGLNRHREDLKDEHGNSHQQLYERGVCRQAPEGHQNGPLRSSSSEWEQDIQNMLPSQIDLHKGTLRFRGSVRGRRASHTSAVHAWDKQQPEDEPQTETEVLEMLNSLRDQPWPLDLRRETKKQLNEKLASSEVKWYSTQPVAKVVRKGGSSLAKVLQANYIWRNVLKRIEGKFGSSVYAFFNFVRAMIQLNLVLSLVVGGGVVAPSVLLATDRSLQKWGWMTMDNSTDHHDPCYDFTLNTNDKFQECSANYTDNLEQIVQDHEWSFIKLVQDFLQGTGFLEWTFLFAGRYPASVSNSSYLVSLAYLVSVIAAYLISFVFVVYFVAKFFRQAPVRVTEQSTTFANIVFTGWDYTVQETAAACTVHICITGEVKAAFDDDQFRQRKLSRTKREYVALILTRACINILVSALIIGGWVGIYFLVDVSQKNLDGGSNKTFFWEYAPTVTVAAFNFLYPLLFTFVVPYEHYRGHTELLVTLIRSVFVRLTSLIVLMFTKLIVISQESRSCDPEDPFICWETHLGQQVYSIFVLDAILQLGMTFVVDVARKALGRFNNPLLKRLSQIEFFVPATRVFRASRSSAMFMTILCLAFLLCLVPNGMALLYLHPSLACSPFRGLDYSWQVLTFYVCKMTGSTYWIRWVVFAVDEEVVVMVLVVTAVLLFIYYLSLVNVRNALIKRLEKKLKHTSNDKVFLMTKHEQQKIVASAGR